MNIRWKKYNFSNNIFHKILSFPKNIIYIKYNLLKYNHVVGRIIMKELMSVAIELIRRRKKKIMSK